MAPRAERAPTPMAVASCSVGALRSIVQDSLGKHLYDNAIFFADKLVTISGAPDDVYRLAQAFVFTKQFRRALTVLRKNKLETTSPRFRYLAAKCLAECSEWDECLAMIDDEALEETKAEAGTGGQVTMHAAMQLLRGSVYEAQENWPLAARCYTSALQEDPMCYEALDRLVTHHMLSTGEQQALLETLQPKLVAAEAEWLLLFYRCKLDASAGKELAEAWEKSGAAAAAVGGAAAGATGGEGGEGGEGEGGAAAMETRGGGDAEAEARAAAGGKAALVAAANSHVLLAAAEYEYCHDHCLACYKLTSKVREQDPFEQSVLPVHICAMVHLNLHADLFYLAHQLVEDYPQQAVSWFAVGSYYHLIADYESARRYFSKAPSLNHRFAPAWVGFGHAFAAQDESDQAMAAYRTASRLFPGSHVPWLGIGIEYLRTNHLHLALQYIKQAQELCPQEPLVLHELGVLHYHNGEYEEAAHFFLQVAENAQSYDAATREPSIFNLGHAYRKLRLFDKAIEWYRAALAISPRLASTYSALGFTEHLRGNLHEAIELYHQSLSLKPDDTFTCEMLTEALKDTLEEPADPTALDALLSPPQGAKGSTCGSSSAEMMDIEPARR